MIYFIQKTDFQENVKFHLIGLFLWNVPCWAFFSDVFIHIFLLYFCMFKYFDQWGYSFSDLSFCLHMVLVFVIFQQILPSLFSLRFI